MKAFKTACKQIRRTPNQALIAIVILFLSFFSLAIFSLISLGSNIILDYFEKSPQVIAFFEKGKDLPESEVNRIKAKLEATGKLADFKYVSTKEAEAIYKEKNKDEPILNELVDYKILPPSIEISSQSIENLVELKNVLEEEPGVVDIAFYEDVVGKMSAWVRNVRYIGLGIISFLLFLSITILTVIIGLKIKNKHREIKIQRLLGASKWYVNSPFLIEGMIYGFFGAILGWLGAFTALQYATPYILEWVGDIIFLPIETNLLIMSSVVLSLIGIVVGAFSSLLSVRRFVKN